MSSNKNRQYWDNLQEEEYRSSSADRRSRRRQEEEGVDDAEESYDQFRDEPDSRDSVQRPQQSTTAAAAGSSRRRSTEEETSNTKKKAKKKKKKATNSTSNGSQTNTNTNTSSVASSSREDYTNTTMSFSGSPSASNNTSNNNPGAPQSGSGDIYAAYSKNKNKPTDLLEAYRKIKTMNRVTGAMRASTANTGGTSQEEIEHFSSSAADTTTTTPSNSNQTPGTSSTQLSTEEDEPQNQQQQAQFANMRIHAQMQRKYSSRETTTTLVPEYGAPEYPAPSQHPLTTEQARTSSMTAKTKNTQKRASRKTRNSATNNNNAVPPKSAKQPPIQQQSPNVPITQSQQQMTSSDYMYSAKAQERSAVSTTPPPPLAHMPPPHVYAVQDPNGNLHNTIPPPMGAVPLQEQAPRASTAATNTTNNNSRTRGPAYMEDSMSSIDDELEASQQQPRHPSNFRLSTELSGARGRESIREVAQYGRRMESVKSNLQRSLTAEASEMVPMIPEERQHEQLSTSRRRKKQRKPKNKSSDDQSAKSSSSSSSSSSGGIMGFLAGFRGHPKQLTEEEQHARGNPFLNRPTAVKKFEKIGAISEMNDFSRKSHLADHHSHASSDSHSLAGTSYSSYEMTLQEKYCPLPPPVAKFQRFCGIIVTNTNFQVFMIVLIMLNALVLGIATYDFANPKIPEALDIIDKIFLVLFTIELALQFGYCGYTLFLDGWLVFDTLTVVTSWWLEGIQVFRSFRIFRSFRLIVRLPLLKNLVLTVFHVMPRIYSILGLLLLVLYVYGVLCTILFGDMYELGQTDEDYFTRLDKSVFTLFQLVTLEGWGDVVRQVRAIHSGLATLIFSTFIIFTGFIMYNLIVAVMCDSMLVIEAQGREEIRQGEKQKQIEAQRAKEEEEQRIIDEMFKQRREEGVKRHRLKGVVSDDSTMSFHDSTAKSSDSTTSWDHMSQVEEEEEIEYREVFCENCECCFEIPKLPPSERRKNMVRDEIVAKTQERVLSLQQKVFQLGETQQRVTAVLQTLMHEIEANRMSAFNNVDLTNHSETNHSATNYSATERSNEDERVRLGKHQ